jgi:hypothetical protein
MTKRTSAKPSKEFVGQPDSIRMPDASAQHSAKGQTPMPTPMAGSVRPASPESGAGSPGNMGRLDAVIAMDDYPRGRGGMNKTAMPSAARQAPAVNRPGVPIGSRPSAAKMP